MTNVDLLLGFLMLGFFIWGSFKGFLWTLIRLASYVGAIVLISNAGQGFQGFLVNLLSISPTIALMISYLILFILMMIAGQLIYAVLCKLIQSLKLGCLNRLAGGALWVLVYFLLLSFIVILIDISPLSLNSRGIRPENKKLNFSKMTSRLEEMLFERSSEIPEVNQDSVQEALEKANEKFQASRDELESSLAMQELYSNMKSNLSKESFEKIVKEIDVYNRETMRFKGHNIEISSLFLQVIVEPMADFLEYRIFRF